ncbi:hypothetical protein J3U21_00330 [Gilliamella sp. B2776]|uniref:hypothetical protein n=1 Tax=unclassified Gilliamella TaxID=2685620 RepID=UPI00226AE590|nr:MULTISPECIES: hypothetical protein [unclassified Gilliamella]MCX8648782.1 hypothetical protein [Gilliamella sp. B2779]MCX8653342.1 hypothetical protein [Gilliamella sp. B2737]MCX8655618.1 hypothetical protein [Gilliamella sp. B2894]MCX8664368.1 hypothetical protein [Gilliamella sp. B2887]MCX8690594.1 hypothetical protein [Gilliamella sp. B2776]
MNPKQHNSYPSNDKQENVNHIDVVQFKIKHPLIIAIMHKLIPFAMLWGSLVLMYGVICMYTNSMGQDEFYRFIFFLRSPFVVVLNCIVLLIAIFHSISWFNLIPKVIFSTRSNKTAQDYLFTAGLWLVTIAISIYLVLFVSK